MGGRGGSSGLSAQNTYQRLPISTKLFGGRNASKEDKAIKRETVSRFMNNAKAGDVYSTGGGVGSSGSEFSIVSYSRSPNKLGIKYGNNRTVAMSRENVAEAIGNGAALKKRKKS